MDGNNDDNGWKDQFPALSRFFGNLRIVSRREWINNEGSYLWTTVRIPRQWAVITAEKSLHSETRYRD
jgi:hypothetical protein